MDSSVLDIFMDSSVLVCYYHHSCHRSDRTSLLIVTVRFINLGSLGDRLPRQGSAQTDSTQLMGRPKGLEQQVERAVQSPTGRSGRGGTTPACRLLRPTSPTGALTSAHLSDQSTRFGLQPPPDSLSDRKAWPKVLLSTPTPTLRPEFTETLLTALL